MNEIHTPAPPRAGEDAKGKDLVSLPSGYLLSRYRLLETLGQGSFGITYRAHDAQLNRVVAIKEYLPVSLAVRHDGTQVLPRSTLHDDDFRWGRDRFLAEAQTLAQVEKAPAIVRVYDFLEANGTAYMVMELQYGETLEARLKRDGRLSAETVERLLYPLLDGLERVHGMGIMHRDIKPANIMLDGEGRPTLLDFGAARAAIAGRTTAMTAVYTPGYAAAEQFSSATQGPYTDIYALAATLYQCVTGTMPPNALERLMDDQLVPATSIATAGGYAPGLLGGIDAGLALKAVDRPQNIALWRPMFAASRPTVASPRRPPAPEEELATRVSRHAPGRAAGPRRGAWRRSMVAAAILLVLGGGVGGYAYWRDVEQRAALERERLVSEARAREAREQAEAEARQREAQRRAEEERAELARRQAEDDKRRAEEDRVRAEAERERQAGRQRAEEEQRRAEAQRLDAERQRLEAERRTAEEARLRLEEERRRVEAQRLEAERRAAEEARERAEQDRLRAEAQRKAAADQGRREAAAPAAAPPALPAPTPASPQPAAAAPAAPKTAAAAPVPDTAGVARFNGRYVGRFCSAPYQQFSEQCWGATVTVSNGVISGQFASARSGGVHTWSGSVTAAGAVTLVYDGVSTQVKPGSPVRARLQGSVNNNVMDITGQWEVSNRGLAGRFSRQE